MPEVISSPKTKVEVCSNAAVICGKQAFNTFDAGGAIAKNLSALFDTLVSAEMSSNRWRFCQTFQEMGVLNTLNPSFDGWLYYWTLPTDLVMVQYVDPNHDYIVFGNMILTKSNHPMTVIYARTVPVSKWPPAFAHYISYALASMIGMSVTNSDRMLARISSAQKEWESRALFADGQSSRTSPIRHNPYIDVRYQNRTRRR